MHALSNAHGPFISCGSISSLISAWYCLEFEYVLRLGKTMENDSNNGIKSFCYTMLDKINNIPYFQGILLNPKTVRLDRSPEQN